MLSVPKARPVMPQTETSQAATAAAAGAPAAMPFAMPEDPYKITLKRPIKTHNGTAYELRLREPVAADFIEVGRVPFDVRGDDDNRRATVDFKCVAQWGSRLTGLDEIILGQLAVDDWLMLVARINMILLNAGSDLGNSNASSPS